MVAGIAAARNWAQFAVLVLSIFSSLASASLVRSFGRNAFEPENLRYLTVAQALADFVEVAVGVRARWKVRIVRNGIDLSPCVPASPCPRCVWVVVVVVVAVGAGLLTVFCAAVMM